MVFKGGKKAAQNRYVKSHPWYSSYNHAKSRCSYNGEYFSRGIKFLMIIDDFEFLWFRDKAFNMKRPSIDRINDFGNYEVSNCRFLEWEDHLRKPRTRINELVNSWDKNKTIKEISAISNISYQSLQKIISFYGLEFKKERMKIYDTSICSLCNKKPLARGLCHLHYHRELRLKNKINSAKIVEVKS